MTLTPRPTSDPTGSPWATVRNFTKATWALVRDGERRMYHDAPALLAIIAAWGIILTADPTDGYLSTRQLHDHGHRVTATKVQLLIEADACRAARCATDARIQIPNHPGWVSLRDLAQWQSLPDDLPTGWQPANTATGYAPPLPVLVWEMPNGHTDAMAEADVNDTRAPERLPELAGGLLILAAVLTTAIAWGRRLRTDPPQWLKRRTPTGTAPWPHHP